MTALETGSHVSHPEVEVVPVSAFRLEPAEETGYLTVDGEVLPQVEPVQVQVLPSIAKIVN
jgi:sphingosine kinase